MADYRLQGDGDQSARPKIRSRSLFSCVERPKSRVGRPDKGMGVTVRDVWGLVIIMLKA